MQPLMFNIISGMSWRNCSTLVRSWRSKWRGCYETWRRYCSSTSLKPGPDSCPHSMIGSLSQTFLKSKVQMKMTVQRTVKMCHIKDWQRFSFLKESRKRQLQIKYKMKIALRGRLKYNFVFQRLSTPTVSLRFTPSFCINNWILWGSPSARCSTR